MISVEEIDPENIAAPAEVEAAAPEEQAPLPKPEPDIEDVPEAPPEAPPPVEQAAPKKRGRPKAPPKEKPVPKPKGRPRKVTVVEEEPEVSNEVVEPPPPLTDNDLRDSLGPILRIYASHLMRGRQGKRARYRELFSRV